MAKKITGKSKLSKRSKPKTPETKAAPPEKSIEKSLPEEAVEAAIKSARTKDITASEPSAAVEETPTQAEAKVKVREEKAAAATEAPTHAAAKERETTAIPENGGLLQLATFKLLDEEFAVDILKIQEINRMVEITAVPNTPDFVEGVINLRGKVIPVIDLRKRFGMPPAELTKHNRIIVTNLKGKLIGLKVDAVSEVLRLPSDKVEPPPPLTKGVESEYIHGVGKLDNRLLILLDIDKITEKSEVGAAGRKRAGRASLSDKTRQAP